MKSSTRKEGMFSWAAFHRASQEACVEFRRYGESLLVVVRLKRRNCQNNEENRLKMHVFFSRRG